MKPAFFIAFLLTAFTAFSQEDSIRGNKFHLTGKLKDKIKMPPHCGIIAWATVIEFDVLEISGMNYSNKSIGIIIPCPTIYADNFFEKGKTYSIVFSDNNQADFGWAIVNKDLLKKNGLSYDPYAILVEKIR